MSIATLNATVRNKKGIKTRQQGFIPAVIYGCGIENQPINLHQKGLINILNQHGERTRVNLNLDGKKEIGIIKAVDTHPVTSAIQHIDIQIVDKSEKVNWEIPIIFLGRELLKMKRLLLQVGSSQIKVNGQVDAIPDMIEVDISNKNANDTITIADLNLSSKIRAVKPSDTVLAIIKYANA